MLKALLQYGITFVVGSGFGAGVIKMLEADAKAELAKLTAKIEAIASKIGVTL